MIEAKLIIDAWYEDGSAFVKSNYGGDCTVLLGMVVKAKRRLEEIEDKVYKYILDHSDTQNLGDPRVIQESGDTLQDS